MNKQATSSALANRNPLRYRGYYYDVETGFYYLQSRYYDPANHRFINADVYASTDSNDAISCNMFAYCGNRPTCTHDPTGYALQFVTVAICDGDTGNPDKTDNVLELLNTNYDIAVDWRWDISGPYQFYNAVKDKGRWDYKRRPSGAEWIPLNGKFRVFGKTMTAEQLGNLNYGFTGAATHFPAPVLRMAGGIVAIKNNGINWSDWWYDFDSKEDYEMVQAGIDMYYMVFRGYSVEEAFKEVWK